MSLIDMPYTPSFVDEAFEAYLAANGAWYLSSTPRGRATLARHARLVGRNLPMSSLAQHAWKSGGSTALKWVAKGTGAVAAGYAIGAIVGTGISYAIFGEEGGRDAFDLYTGNVSPSEYFDTVSQLFN